MNDTNVERTKQELIELNKQIGKMEDHGEEAREYFKKRLSDHLLFRRANGTIVEREALLKGLKGDKRFKSRESDLISVSINDKNDRALVTLVVVGTKHNDIVYYHRNVRLFARQGDEWLMEFWYNYEIPYPYL